MAVQTRSTLKGWFLAGLKPLASQFADWIDSFWHKSDTINISDIEGLQTELDALAGGGGGGTGGTLATLNTGATIVITNTQSVNGILLRSATTQTIKIGTSAGASDIGVYSVGSSGTLHDEFFLPASTLTLHFTSAGSFTVMYHKIQYA
jgi:hypothetical protein